MIRKDREIRDIAQIEDIIRHAMVCRLALSDDGCPYIVPLCFGYENRTLYFHCAGKGRKTDIIAKNNQVCVEFDIDSEIKTGENACKCSMRYRSVIGFGKAYLIDDADEKRHALDMIMAHYLGKSPFEYSESALKNTLIIRIDIEEMTGKQNKTESVL
jgi:nitroimidazol reductase NimA-like FMN-containing flavoprotein (pyridoxamine 5'-phosphate oxidase superfamily)